jgi:hypothetical protein
MGITSWWRKFRAREDDSAIRKAAEAQNESAAERRYGEGYTGLGADQAASAGMHGAEPNIGSADRLSED